MNTIKLKLAALALAAPFLLLAQDAPFTCSTHGLQHMQRFLQGHPERVQQMEQADQHLEQFTAHFAQDFDARGGNTYVIPVVFHIIHLNGEENISDDQVKDAMRVLNNDFNKLNDDWDNVQSEFLPIVADVGITFRLAGLDPDGNCTSGITRTVSDLTNDGGQDMKDLIQWPRDQYLNVWVCAYAQGAAGYTQTPANVDDFWGAAADGIVLLHNYTGSIGTSSPGRSRTLTHEVGHWINLRHCWGPSNDPGLPENCDLSDNVADTPPTEGWTSCNVNGATCGSAKDNVENYMEYSYCSKMFTNGQKARMIAALNSGTADRENLWTLENLEATGTADPQPLCSASFICDRRIVCAGESVQFNDESYHGVISWQWNFPGGTPASSNEENPIVTYAAPGLYAVELTVGNGANTEMVVLSNYITVMPDPGVPLPFAEGFEDMTAFGPEEWIPSNPDADLYKFDVNTTAGYSSAHSVRMRNFGNVAGRVDELFGPSIDLSQDTAVVLSFRYAFARRTSTNDDILRFYVSKDCGETWSLRRQLRGSNGLPTAPDQNSAFTPDGTDEWAQTVITTITSTFLVSDFRFKFWFESDGGNDLWIDDININGGIVGLDELSSSSFPQVTVAPNPVTESAIITAVIADAGMARVEVLDATGRAIAVLNNGRVAAGTQSWSLPAHALADGIYVVRVGQEGGEQVVRFVKE